MAPCRRYVAFSAARHICETLRKTLPAGRVASAARLEQVPDPLFRLVDPDFEQARRGDVASLVAHAVRPAHVRCQTLVVLTQLGEHVERTHVFGVVVENALQLPDLADRAHPAPPALTNALPHCARPHQAL